MPASGSMQADTPRAGPRSRAAAATAASCTPAIDTPGQTLLPLHDYDRVLLRIGATEVAMFGVAALFYAASVLRV
jgi:hypothetical protein